MTIHIISGKRLTFGEAFHAARSMGFEGSHQTFYRRLKGGATTWEELMRPMRAFTKSEKFKSSMEIRKAKRVAEREEISQICREIDERKAQG